MLNRLRTTIALPGALGGLREFAQDTARTVRNAVRPRAAGGMTGLEMLTYNSIYAGYGAVGEVVSPYEALQCAPVYAVIKVLSQSMAQVEMHMHARDEQGGSLGREIDHPLARLLASDPSEHQTWYEFRQYMQSQLSLFGNAFAWITRDAHGEVFEVLPLPPDRVAITLDDANAFTPLYTVSAPEGRTWRLQRRDILHIHDLGGRWPFRGESPVLINWRTIRNWLAQEDHLLRLFGRAARPAGILETDHVLSPESVARLRTQMDATHGGHGSGQTLVLEQGMKFKPASFSSVESQFLELRKEQLQNVARIWRVPPLLLQDSEKAIGSTAETFGRWFVTHTLGPLLEAWEKAFSISLLAPEDRRRFYLQHDTAEFTQAESQTRWQAYVAGLTNGVLSANEVRSAEHLPPIEGGDIYRTPVNSQPATQQYHGQNSHVIDPNPALTAPLQTPQPGRTGHALVPFQASEARMIETRNRLELALTRAPARLRLAGPPRAAAKPPAEPWIEIETPSEEKPDA